jgi:hypothetical protein
MGKMQKVIIGSKKPIVLMHTDLMYEKLINVINEILKKTNLTPFKFTNNQGRLVEERYRYSYQINNLITDLEALPLIKHFAIKVIPEFIKKLKSEIYEPEYKINQQEKLRYCLRIRVLEDKAGYC